MIAFDAAPDDTPDLSAALPTGESRVTQRKATAYLPHWSFCQPAAPEPATSAEAGWLRFLGVESPEPPVESGDHWESYLR